WRVGMIPLLFLEQCLPAHASVRAEKYFIVRMPAAKSRDDNVRRMLRIDRDGSVTERLNTVRRFKRRDVRPLTRRWRIFPHRAIRHGVGSGFASIGQVNLVVRRKHHMIWPQAHRLTRYRLPGPSAIIAPE